MSCAVYGCTNSTATATDPAVQYYNFPKHPVFAQQWITACWRADPIDINTAQICSIHFDNNSYGTEYKYVDYLGHYVRLLRLDAVPTLYLPHPHTASVIKPAVEQQPITLGTEDINQHEVKQIMVYNVTDQITTSGFNETSPEKKYIEIDPTRTHILEVDTIKFNSVNDHSEQSSLSMSNSQKKCKKLELLERKPAILEDPRNPEEVYVEIDLNQAATLEVNPVKCNSLNQQQQSLDDPKEQDDINDERYKVITTREELSLLKDDNKAVQKTIAKLEETLKKLRGEATEKRETLKSIDEEIKRTLQNYDRLLGESLSLMEQKNILARVFSESQIKILTGKKKIYWSNDDMAMGYTIRNLSNKRCYMYLSKNLNIPLPALSSIKRWITLKKGEFDKPEKKEKDTFPDEDTD